MQSPAQIQEAHPPNPGGTEPSDSDGSHTEAGTFCALRRPSLISNRRRAPRHPRYPTRAQGLIALAVKRLPRTRGTVGTGEALGRLASVSLYIICIYIYFLYMCAYIYIYIYNAVLCEHIQPRRGGPQPMGGDAGKHQHVLLPHPLSAA